MKRVLSVFKYQLRELVRPTSGFYVVIALIYVILIPTLMSSVDSSVQGIEGASAVFLFVMGLNMFKSAFLFTQANGVTRKHFYLGSVMAVAAAALFMTFVDALLGGVFRLFTTRAQSLSAMIFPGSAYVPRMLWTLAANLVATALGWLITMLFYRSGKAMKLVLAIGPGVLLCVVLPIVDTATGGLIGGWIWKALAFVLGLAGKPSPVAGALWLVVTTAALAFLSFLLVRRAPVKEQSR